ncbi:MAG: nicotinate-nucleotide adenylyltransferase [Rikenellaceae bacterium]|nr:nicotinate-nucleotide adenylyltransferase [Rikenellaceae bacterium]
MKNVILFFGSFNPIHRAHLSIAEYVLDKGFGDEVWFIVSPQNPFKQIEDLAPKNDRMRMVEIAIEKSIFHNKMKVSDIEFNMPKPSYTIDTLSRLWSLYPDCKFSILMGSDNLLNLGKWKDYQDILKNCRVFVYERKGYPHSDKLLHLGDIFIIDNPPLYDISSTEFRNLLKKGDDIKDFLPEGVYEYIKQKNIYATSNDDR